MNREAFARGELDCYRDRCQNVPFASIGGLDHRHQPWAPKWVIDMDDDYYTECYMEGYYDAAEELFGPDWRTCEFRWQSVMMFEAEDKP